MSDPDIDPRLHIYRREVFDRDLEEDAAHALRSGRPLTIILLDLDKFKAVNDQHGHLVGDEVLETFAALMRPAVGEKGRCYRYGGDEFCVLLSNYTANEGASLAERIRLHVEITPVSSEQLRITISSGVAELPSHAQAAKELVKRADEALYQAKDLGRNLVRISGESPETEAIQESIKRRRPEPGGLSEHQMTSIRQDYFRVGYAECPDDGGRLEVREVRSFNRRTPTLFVSCPLCGRHAKLEGPS